MSVTRAGRSALFLIVSLPLALGVSGARAQDGDDSKSRVNESRVNENRVAFNGDWVWNPDLSDNADRQVERAIRAAGGVPGRGKKRDKKSKDKSPYKYKGGPASHKLYDYLSYDEAFRFDYAGARVRIAYSDGFTREFYSDGRSRSASVSGGEIRDFSFASWDGAVLYVEARPRDGGKTSEVYRLIDDGARMRVEMELRPLSFGAGVRLSRVFDRRVAGRE